MQADGTLATPVCPFPGMTPFSEKDRASFYGRDVEIREAVNRIRLYPFLAVIGSSGSGKSSLVYAGIVPALRDSPHFGRATLEVKSMRPGPAPLSALAALFDLPEEAQYSLAPRAMADGTAHLGSAR